MFKTFNAFHSCDPMKLGLCYVKIYNPAIHDPPIQESCKNDRNELKFAEKSCN